MMRDADTGFHTPPDPPYDWAEASFFYFYVPRARVMASVYFVGRAGVGAMMSDIQIYGDLGMSPLDTWYADTVQHQKIPPRFDKFTLPCGLSFEALNLRKYRIDYVGINDTELHVDVASIMDPYDINDPKMDPLAADTHANPESTGFGHAFSAHYDMSVHVVGTLRVRGRSYDVDCIATMDHSWGQRSERGMRPVCWINAHFDRGNVIHGIFSHDPLAAPEQRYTFHHGYALVDDKVRGAVASRMVGYHLNRFAIGYDWQMTDVDGREHRIYGSPVAMQLWAPYSSIWVPNILIRWQNGARVGWGNSAENNPLPIYAGGQLANRAW
jgi:hypothetical protein